MEQTIKDLESKHFWFLYGLSLGFLSLYIFGLGWISLGGCLLALVCFYIDSWIEKESQNL